MIGQFEIKKVEDSFTEIKSAFAFGDVTITDPPYTAVVHKNLCSGSGMGIKRGSVPHRNLDFAPVENYEFARALVERSTRWCLIFCPVEAFGWIHDLCPTEYIRGALWLKPNSMGQLTGDRPACAYEGISILHPKGRKRWNGNGSYGVWSANSTRGVKGRHPNQKPLDLCLKLVALFSERGETVFDPFCGSGAIGQAAIALGRNYVGWDCDQARVDSARASLEKVTSPAEDEYALNLCKPWGKSK
jgi:site-specific DNA-methyltransferase (adenine-specific)